MENQIAVPRKETGFSMVTQESLGRKISINPREERITTVFSESSRMKGDFLLKDGIKIDGSIEGSVIFGTDDGMCIVSKTGVVDGSIAGPRAFILGTVQGDIAIEGVLLLAPSAVVMGNVSYGRLIVLDGAQVSGQFNMNTRKQHLANTSLHGEETPVVQLKNVA